MKKYNPNDDLVIRYCLHQVERKLNWIESSHWRHSDFQRLSDIIYQHTNYTVSSITLKRTWGKVPYEGHPSPSTLDALSIYLGYNGWPAFKQENMKAASRYFGGKETDRAQKLRRFLQPNKKSLYWLSGVLGLLLISSIVIFVFFLGRRISVNQQKNFEFKVVNPKGTVPYSVRFHYNVANLQADSIYIIAGDDNRKHYVNKSDHFMTRVYFNPGHYMAKLGADGRILDSVHLFAFTDDWLGYMDLSDKAHPYYFHGNEIYDSGRLHISDEFLTSQKFIKLDNELTVNFYNVRSFDVNGDHFYLETRVKNTPFIRGGNICQHANIGVLTENGFITIPLINPGCISMAKIFISNVKIDGWTNDLSGFARDMDKWHILELSIEDKQAEILVDQQKAYELSYSEPLGEVMGFRYEFHGNGSVDYVKLFNSQQELIYEDHFTK